MMGDKTVILDIRAKTDDGTIVNIEVQVRNAGQMDRRSLFYWSREYAKGIESGKTYDELPNVITINIVDYEFLEVDAFHTTFHLWEDTHRAVMLTDALEIHFIDMVKFRRLKEKDIKGNPLHRWLTFFDKNATEDALKEVFSLEAAILKAHEKMSFLSSDPEARSMYELREKGLLDYRSGLYNERQQGMNEKAIAIATKMLKRNTPITHIIEDTELDEATILNLQATLSGL
jgi:predicted transposase/invertase (TIGR01784 family)